LASGLKGDESIRKHKKELRIRKAKAGRGGRAGAARRGIKGGKNSQEGENEQRRTTLPISPERRGKSAIKKSLMTAIRHSASANHQNPKKGCVIAHTNWTEKNCRGEFKRVILMPGRKPSGWGSRKLKTCGRGKTSEKPKI